jgi:hypothetical protein
MLPKVAVAVALAVTVASVDAASPAAASLEALSAPRGGWPPPPSWAVVRAGARTMERVVAASVVSSGCGGGGVGVGGGGGGGEGSDKGGGESVRGGGRVAHCALWCDGDGDGGKVGRSRSQWW